jgi:nitrate/nitrite transport system permease protein
MIFQLNLAAIAAIAGQTAWKKTKPVISKDVFFLPVLGFLGIIVLWWIVALANHELMPTPPEALSANLDYILNPFYQRGPGNLGIGWLLIASLRRVILGFLLGAVVAIPLGFLIGMSSPQSHHSNF